MFNIGFPWLFIRFPPSSLSSLFPFYLLFFPLSSLFEICASCKTNETCLPLSVYFLLLPNPKDKNVQPVTLDTQSYGAELSIIGKQYISFCDFRMQQLLALLKKKRILLSSGSLWEEELKQVRGNQYKDLRPCREKKLQCFYFFLFYLRFIFQDSSEISVLPKLELPKSWHSIEIDPK